MRAQQGCVEGAAGSEADADATALAIINLIKAHEKSKPVQDAVDKAAAWLADKQRNSGGVRGGATISKLNTNTTALSGYALGLAKNTDAAMLAARWVRRNQPVDKYKCRTALTRELGAVAYRGSSVSDARSGGISEDARGEWQRATAQAILGLQWAPASPYKLEVRRKWRRVRAGHKPPFKVFGLAPGERGCLQVKGEFKRVTGKKSGAPLTRRLRMPAGNRGRFIIVKTADDRDRTWVRVRNR